MLVFLSDLHLTDGSSGETIKPKAFEILVDNLGKLAEAVSPLHEIRLVLLGDVFDVIRSCQWLDAKVRPWDAPSPEQENTLLSILDEILLANQATLAHLRDTGAIAKRLGVPFHIDYTIGNHDWLINRYPSASAKICAALDLPVCRAFPDEFFEPNYQVVARHGDIYDPFNFTGRRDASSLGDAIVIELLDRYPQEVEQALEPLVLSHAITAKEKVSITARLKELDNLRPVTEAAAWVLSVLGETRSHEAKRIIESTWQKCVKEFFGIPYVSKFSWFRLFPLRLALMLSSWVRKPLLERVLGWLNLIVIGNRGGQYCKWARKERRVRSGEAAYVLYGHTHEHVIVPLPRAAPACDRVYFNTGTWRMTWNKALKTRDFVGWHVLTYVTVFAREENRDYNFEVWNGSLGQNLRANALFAAEVVRPAESLAGQASAALGAQKIAGTLSRIAPKASL